MMTSKDRQRVRSRANERCEYCKLRQEHCSLWRNQIEHIVALKHHGSDELENLALACVRCNLGKSSNLDCTRTNDFTRMAMAEYDVGSYIARISHRSQTWSASGMPGRCETSVAAAR